MERGELAITVLGLVATFCLPWPGADRQSQPVAQACAAPPEAPRMASLRQIYVEVVQPAR
jgi:hypothetical protein